MTTPDVVSEARRLFAESATVRANLAAVEATRPLVECAGLVPALCDEVERGLAGMWQLLEQRDALLGWLVEGLGYPFDGPDWTFPRFPELLQRQLAAEWHAHEGRADETVDDYLDSCAAEGGWSMSDVEIVAREAAIRASLRGDK